VYRLGIDPRDLEESFTRSSGPGGQNVNKVATAVTLRHRPSGVSVTAQDSRSQAQNRALALDRLLSALENRAAKLRAEKVAAAAKKRRQTSPRPPRLKRKILDSKIKRARLKKLRGKVAE
jgi:protein subunit release factor B